MSELPLTYFDCTEDCIAAATDPEKCVEVAKNKLSDCHYHTADMLFTFLAELSTCDSETR